MVIVNECLSRRLKEIFSPWAQERAGARIPGEKSKQE